ncbi:MAG: hypothetical protein FJ087_18935 [Deltaproteobacteria bacterium]|nr:hypothetical protein [Deltaproteobacteria bacterium]
MDADLKFDRRLVDRLIAKGAMTREEYEKHLEKLPDVTAQALNAPSAPEAAAPAAAPAKPSKKKRK